MVEQHAGAGEGAQQPAAEGHAAEAAAQGGEQIIAHEEVEPGKVVPFAFLVKADKARVAEVLQDMKEEELVAVLSYLTPTDAAAVIKNFSEERQIKTLVAMADRRQLSTEQIQQIEASMQDRMEHTVGGAYQISRIIDKIGEETSKKLLAQLQGNDGKKDVYEKLRKELVLFEDMSLQGDDTLQKVLRNVDTSDLAIALKGAPAQLVERVTKNLTEGAAQILQEEMEFGGTESPARIAQAQETICGVIRRMEAEGRVVFQRGGAATKA